MCPRGRHPARCGPGCGPVCALRQACRCLACATLVMLPSLPFNLENSKSRTSSLARRIDDVISSRPISSQLQDSKSEFTHSAALSRKLPLTRRLVRPRLVARPPALGFPAVYEITPTDACCVLLYSVFPCCAFPCCAAVLIWVLIEC